MPFSPSSLTALLPLLDERISKETNADLLLQLRFIHSTASKIQVTQPLAMSAIEESAVVLSSLEKSLPQLTAPTDRLDILTSLSCICSHPDMCRQIARGCVPQVMVEWLQQDSSDEMHIKVFAVLSALAEAGTLAEDVANETLRLITHQLSVRDVISPALLLVLVVFVEAASNSSECVGGR